MPKTSSRNRKSKFQTKILTSNVASSETVSELTFNNLVVGKNYRVILQASLTEGGNSNTANGRVEIEHDEVFIGRARVNVTSAIDGNSANLTFSTESIFTATATTLTFEYIDGGTAQLQGNGGGSSRAQTFATLEELPNHEETTDFT